jgi:hypothetical protein
MSQKTDLILKSHVSLRPRSVSNWQQACEDQETEVEEWLGTVSE